VSTDHHDHPELGPAELTEVADGVFAYIQPDGSWWINNTGFVVGPDAVISVDAYSTERRTRAYLERVATVTPGRVSTLINTHHHGDHTYGNSVIGATTIIGHERCREEMLAAGLLGNTGIWDDVDWGELTLAPPTLTFTDQVRLWSGDRPVEVRYVGQSAHTTNDCVVWLPEDRVLFCGDLLFNGGTPFVLMGSATGLVSVLEQTIAAIPAVVIVPGHGAPCDRGLIDDIVGYLQLVIQVATAGLAAHLTPLDAARQTDLGGYADWLDSERIVGNLHRAYADLDPVGHPVDILAALLDMVSYNGGRPLSCYA
jgi:cyclase